jgi:predicted methyltransferase
MWTEIIRRKYEREGQRYASDLDEALVRSEIEAAGFQLIDHGDFLHVPADARDAPSHSAAQPVDIYALKFRKPG